MTTHSIHASCVAMRGTGVLIRGGSGSGKSLTAWRLIEAELDAGREAGLVADDRVILSHDDSYIVATAPETLAGLIELRGIGIVRRSFIRSIAIGLVVDLIDAGFIRFPEPSDLKTTLLGVELPRISVPAAMAVTLIQARLKPDLDIVSPDIAV